MIDFKVKQGGHFEVIVFDEFVLKFPKYEPYRKMMPLIAKAQRDLSKQLTSVLPAREIGNYCLLVPKAKGKLLKEIEEPLKSELHKRAWKEAEKVKELGYEITDTKDSDIIYNEELDIVYLIDFSTVKKVDISTKIT
jgi:hypothetical protein